MSIRESIELEDLFTPVLENIVSSVNHAASAMEYMQKVMNTPVDYSSLNASQYSADKLGSSLKYTADVSAYAQYAFGALGIGSGILSAQLLAADTAAQHFSSSVESADYNCRLAAKSASTLFSAMDSINSPDNQNTAPQTYDEPDGHAKIIYRNVGSAPDTSPFAELFPVYHTQSAQLRYSDLKQNDFHDAPRTPQPRHSVGYAENQQDSFDFSGALPEMLSIPVYYSLDLGSASDKIKNAVPDEKVFSLTPLINPAEESSGFADSFKNAVKGCLERISELSDLSEPRLSALKQGFDSLAVSSGNAAEAMAMPDAAGADYGKYENEIGALSDLFGAAADKIRGLFSVPESVTADIDAQINAFARYRDALEQLSALGIDSGILSALEPDKAVSFADELAKLDLSGAKLKLQELNDSFAGLSETKENTMKGFSDIRDMLNDGMNALGVQLADRTPVLADGLEFSDKAAAAAQRSLDAYTQNIIHGGNIAIAAARRIADSISDILSSAGGTVNIGVSTAGSIPGHAKGSTNAEDVFIAGENGPELIVGKAGSTVFPASETDRIISAVSSASSVGGISYNNNNSYYTSENRHDNSSVKNFENVVNNYSTVQNLSDSSGILSAAEAFGQRLEKYSSDMPETGDEIRNYNENLYSADNSRSFSTSYGGALSSFNDYSAEYGASVSYLSDSYENADNSRSFSVNYGGDSSVRNSALSSGDSIRSISSRSDSYDNSRSYASYFGGASAFSNINSDYYGGDSVNGIYSRSESYDNSRSDISYLGDDIIHSFFSRSDSIDNSRSDISYLGGDVMHSLFNSSENSDSRRFEDNSRSYGESYVSRSDIFDNSSIAENSADSFDNRRIFSSYGYGGDSIESNSYAVYESGGGNMSGDAPSAVKRIELDINGNGSIGVQSGMDRGEVVSVLLENLKPVLMNIVEQEIFEEGESAYDY